MDKVQSEKQPSVLVVDDEADLRQLLEITLSRMGMQCSTAASLGEARELLGRQPFDLCLTDMRLPDGRGMELVEDIQRDLPALPVAIITAYGDMELAVEALRKGAFDCVSKPLDIDQLRALVNQALGSPVRPDGDDELVGNSAPMRTLKSRIEKLAKTEAPVCIWGESGTGKEIIARQIHARSHRGKGPFIAVNCGAIPEDLIESEFFGHLKGSFTGAAAQREGFFQAAEGGTLFLDEIGDMPMSMQVKLLRAIQERKIRPVGAEHEQLVDVRILSASHKQLHDEVASGNFRQDLYYRVNVIELQVPPLRERSEDISALSRTILEKITRRNKESGIQCRAELTDAALEELRLYAFPGNVRELENILERALALCEAGRITPADLSLSSRPVYASSGSSESDVDECEQLVAVLEQYRWNRSAAARQLGLTLRQLRYRIQKYGLDQDLDQEFKH
ncbi:sigma-54-dependent transcriptional regulator [Marinobacterium mangrovicola]|uniref:Two-component response regulator PilR n=1 Tax=Marinobacterium mangrovicola TaxID=1476959 RepID=A0A4R1H430_9GAMM|nr:sigma-54 dependent transcriptional regulator [Marinobacterium mangrovicola]TCK16424.1 two-component response regulator PilR [Marinobacterium mangrovicola]